MAFAISQTSSGLRPPVTGMMRVDQALLIVKQEALKMADRFRRSDTIRYLIWDRLARGRYKEALEIIDLFVTEIHDKRLLSTIERDDDLVIFRLAVFLSNVLSCKLTDGENIPLEGDIILLASRDRIDVGECRLLKTPTEFAGNSYRTDWDISFYSFRDGTTKDVRVYDRSAIILLREHSLRNIPTPSMEFIEKLLGSKNLEDARLSIQPQSKGSISSLGGVQINDSISLEPGDIIYCYSKDNPEKSYPARLVSTRGFEDIIDYDGEGYPVTASKWSVALVPLGGSQEKNMKFWADADNIFLLSKKWQVEIYRRIRAESGLHSTHFSRSAL